MNSYAIKQQAKSWKDTNIREIQIFIGIMIYIGIYHYPILHDYWQSDLKKKEPIYPITLYIRRNRFKDLKRYFYISDPADKLKLKLKSKRKGLEQDQN